MWGTWIDLGGTLNESVIHIPTLSCGRLKHQYEK